MRHNSDRTGNLSPTKNKKNNTASKTSSSQQVSGYETEYQRQYCWKSTEPYSSDKTRKDQLKGYNTQTEGDHIDQATGYQVPDEDDDQKHVDGTVQTEEDRPSQKLLILKETQVQTNITNEYYEKRSKKKVSKDAVMERKFDKTTPSRHDVVVIRPAGVPSVQSDSSRKVLRAPPFANYGCASEDPRNPTVDHKSFNKNADGNVIYERGLKFGRKTENKALKDYKERKQHDDGFDGTTTYSAEYKSPVKMSTKKVFQDNDVASKSIIVRNHFTISEPRQDLQVKFTTDDSQKVSTPQRYSWIDRVSKLTKQHTAKSVQTQ